MNEISSAPTSPLTIDFTLNDVESRPNSPTILPDTEVVADSSKGTGNFDNTTSIRVVAHDIDPNAKIKFDIKALTNEARSSLREAIVEQNKSRVMQQEKAEAFEKAPLFSWMRNVIPIYDFTQRTKLYNAAVKAQIKFSQNSSLVRLQETHVAYLNALSKSGLSPEEQHTAYKKFEIALADACKKRVDADTEEARSVGCSTGVKKYFAKRDANLKNEASRAEQNVQKLLKEISPHIESRHNVAQVLRYKEFQWHQISDKTSDEAQSVKADIQTIVKFQRGGGFDSLGKSEAENFNKLFKDASEKYKIFQDQEDPLKRKDAEDIFKAADAAVINRIGTLLYPPPTTQSTVVNSSPQVVGLRDTPPLVTIDPSPSDVSTTNNSLISSELQSLKAFAEKQQKSLEHELASLSVGKTSPKEAIFKQQKTSLTKLLGVLNNSATPPEKLSSLKPLIDLMKQIEEKNRAFKAVEENDSEKTLIEQTGLNLMSEFMLEVQKFSFPS